MLKRLDVIGIILLSFLLFYKNSFAQEKQQIDSLLLVFKNQKSDTGRISTLIDLSILFSTTGNISQAKKYAGDAISLAEKNVLKKQITAARINLGSIYKKQGNTNYYNGNYEEALRNYLAALTIFEKNQFKNGIATIRRNIGLVHWVQGDYDEAVKNYMIVLGIYKREGDRNGMAVAYNDLGNAYENKGNYSKAFNYYMASLKSYEETGNKEAMINRYFNIAFLFADQGNYTEALRNHYAALNLCKEIGNKEGIAACYTNIGGIYFQQGSSQPAVERRQKLFNEALDYYLIAIEIYEASDDKEALASCYNALGGTYLEVKNFTMAKHYLVKGLSLFEKVGSMESSEELYQLPAASIRDNYQLQAKLDSATGNWQESLRNHKLFILYRDSVTNETTANIIMKTQLEYDFIKKEDSLKYQQLLTSQSLRQQTFLTRQQKQALLLKEQELVLVNSEKKMQQLQIEKDRANSEMLKSAAEKKDNMLSALGNEKAIHLLQLKKQQQQKYYMVALLSLFSVLSFFIYHNFRTRQKLKLQTLRIKIATDLHDEVGSTLSSISIITQMAQQKAHKADPIMETIGESSRKTLDAMSDIVWAINPENDEFEKILFRMKNFAADLLNAKNIDFKFLVDEEAAKLHLPMNVRKNLYLVFKEAINNMAKHSEASKATFEILKQKTSLDITIWDNGKGLLNGQSATGNGLKNMRKRSKEIGALLKINSEAGKGTAILLSIQV